MSWLIPATSDIPELHYVKDILYFDGPLTSLFEDALGQRYVLHWGDTVEEEGKEVGDIYLLLKIPDAVLYAWLESGPSIHSDWRAVFIQATLFAFVEELKEETTVTLVNAETAEIYMPMGK